MRRMHILAVVAMVQMLAVGGVVFAQGPGAGRHGGGPGFGGPGAVLRGLDLSEAQRTQVRAIVERHRNEQRAEIFALLTPDQQAKLKQMEERRAAHLKQRLDKLQQQP